ncbi:MAG: hypothetical protein AAGM36_13095 [Cyanobacteria bacterium J06597_1]
MIVYIAFSTHIPGIILCEEIPPSKWEEHWLKESLRPFEVKMLARKRCRKDILDKAEEKRLSAREFLIALQISHPDDKIFSFIVSPGIEGMSWGGYAKVNNGKITKWIRTWFS